LCPPVVSFNSVIAKVEYFIIVTQATNLPLHTIKCCSVIFGVTSRLLDINTSSSSPATNELHRLLATCVINLPWSVAAKCIALGAKLAVELFTVHDGATYWLRSRILHTPHAFPVGLLEYSTP